MLSCEIYKIFKNTYFYRTYPMAASENIVLKFLIASESQEITYCSLEIQAIKLWLLLIHKNMLKSIATARNVCTAKQESKARYNTGQIASDLIDFFGDNWIEIKTQTEKRNIHNCEKYLLTKSCFVVSNFREFPKDHTGK